MIAQRIWSEELGRRLLRSLSSAELARQWGPTCSQEHLRCDLLDWARQDAEVRDWIVRTRRETHEDVVAAVDQMVIDGLTPNAVRRLESFPREETLLTLLTDEFDDGRELAGTFLSRLDGDGHRRALRTVLDRLVGEGSEVSRRRLRVVILGGNHRDQGRLAERLFDNGPFDVRWRAFEKKPSSGTIQKSVVRVLHHADATVIITGMASHMLMQLAKDCAHRFGIPYRCIEKATENQLKAALHEMFPDLTVDWI